ncbi:MULTISPECIES: DUF4339 domain-containing protein [Clostridium]|uniref:DUF4339 domain-containing protein n=1 Tax=Clostridium TaxID=1485 RepID=UPI0008267B5F|nr:MULTISPECIES: DUF4339 domain-containing protein [Clostridium]PJI07516.1 hypothetical protein CUB90_06415 [Clostridium sp. CT7]
MDNNIGNIYELCGKTSMKRYYYKDSIPEKKIINAKKAYPLPDSEKIIALCDSTISGNGKNGLVICESGVFLKNMTQKVRHVTWDDFITRTIAIQNSAICVGEFRFFVNNGPKDQICDFLQDIQKVLIEENKNKVITNEKIKQLCKLCEKVSMKYYCSSIKISSEKITNVRKNYCIPDSEKIIALFDEGKSEEKVGCGIAICQGGLYIKNTLLRAVHISWENFIRNKLEIKGTALIIGGFNFISTIVVRSELPQFMQKIQNLLLEDEDSTEKNTNASTSEDNITTNKINDIEPKWKIAINGKQCGTFDKKTLKCKINSGELKIQDCYAWKFGMSDWIPLLQIQELKDLIDESFFNVPPLPNEINNMNYKSEVEDEKIDINNCSLDDLLNLDCMNLKNSKLILDKRKGGMVFNSVEDVEQLLQLKPHQVEEIREKLSFNKNDFNLEYNNGKKESHSRLIDY